MDNSSENRQEQENQAASASFHGTNPPENNLGAGNSVSSMDFCFVSSVVWTAEEQAILDEGLKNYASEPPIKCYTKIAADLHTKTVRDVAYRYRWMTEKEVSNRKKEIYRTGRSINRRERISDTSVEPPSCSPLTTIYSNGSTMMHQAVGGEQRLLVRCNYQILYQIEANLKSCKLEENMALFYQFRDNFTKIMSYSMDETPEFTSQMPPFPLNVEEELENIFQLLSSSQDPNPEPHPDYIL